MGPFVVRNSAPFLTTGLAASLLVAVGCTSVGGSAIATGSLRVPPYSGPVAIYAASKPIGTELGLVEVHGSLDEGGVDQLLPLFVRKVAQLGGNAAVIEGVRGRFDFVTRPHTETFTYPCGFYRTCIGTRAYALNDEVLTVTMVGKAFLVGGAPPAAVTPQPAAADGGAP